MLPPYAVLPRATHVDRRRRVSGAAVVEEGCLEATWTGAVECGPAALVRIRHQTHQRQHAGTDAQWKHAHSQGLGYGGLQ